MQVLLKIIYLTKVEFPQRNITIQYIILKIKIKIKIKKTKLILKTPIIKVHQKE